MNLSDIAILNIKGANYCCIVSGISKSEAISLMQKWLDIVKHKSLSSHIKMSKEILTFGEIEIKKKRNFTAIKVLIFRKCKY